MRPKNRNLSTALLLVSATIIVSASAIAGGNGKPAPLIIQGQGSFGKIDGGIEALNIPGSVRMTIELIK